MRFSFSRSVKWPEVLLAAALIGLQACTFASVAKPGGAGGAGGSSASGTGGVASATGGVSGSGTGGAMAPPSVPCVNLQCQQTTCTNGPCKEMACPAGGKTTLSGTVYDPAGKVPLYNIVVYVPNVLPLPMLVDGATCDKCQTTIPDSVTATLTDAAGAFTLDNVPVGTDIPLVIQVGKWRRQITIPNVPRCANTPLTDKNLTRLPKNKTEGHIPKIALTTGGVDALECLLRKIGIEDTEFTPEAGTGRVNLFAGGMLAGVPENDNSPGTNAYNPMMNAGAMFTAADTWWESLDNLKKYDIVLHSCEGLENPNNKSMPARAALQEYLNIGGRVFASHWHNYWIEFGPIPLSTVAMFDHQGVLGNGTFTSTIDVTFPKGMALADWLVNVGASIVRGQLPIVGAKQTVTAVTPMLAQRWIYSDTPVSVQYLTANTPVGAAAELQCGRVVFSDLHVSSGAGTLTEDRSVWSGSIAMNRMPTPFPTGCVTQDLSPQEKALEFMLFDLSSCIRRDDVPPVVR